MIALPAAQPTPTPTPAPKPEVIALPTAQPTPAPTPAPAAKPEIIALPTVQPAAEPSATPAKPEIIPLQPFEPNAPAAPAMKIETIPSLGVDPSTAPKPPVEKVPDVVAVPTIRSVPAPSFDSNPGSSSRVTAVPGNRPASSAPVPGPVNSSNAAAQAAPVACKVDNCVTAVIFNGAGPYTDADLRPIAGIYPGAVLTQSMAQAAAQHLFDTGLFADAQAETKVDGKTETLIFNLTPAPESQLARPSFANLVWFTPAEIDADLREHVKLYNGRLPLQGNGLLVDAVQAELRRMLAAQRVDATLTHTAIAPSDLHPYNAIEFRVTSPPVRLASATVIGDPGSLLKAQLVAQTEALKLNYNEGIAGTTIEDVLLAPARSAGYITASLVNIHRERMATGGGVSVVFSARLAPGPIFHVKSVAWAPTGIYSATDFARDTPLRIGQVPTDDALLATERPILAAYHAHGYAEARVNVATTTDDATASVNYVFTVTPGEVYHLQSVTAKNLSPAAQAEFDSIWSMKPGDVYDEQYVINFLNNNRGVKALNAYTFEYQFATNPQTRLVDLTLNFKPRQ